MSTSRNPNNIRLLLIGTLNCKYVENSDRRSTKNKIEHNEEILRDIWNRIMGGILIWYIIPTSLVFSYSTHFTLKNTCSTTKPVTVIIQ